MTPTMLFTEPEKKPLQSVRRIPLSRCILLPRAFDAAINELSK